MLESGGQPVAKQLPSAGLTDRECLSIRDHVLLTFRRVAPKQHPRTKQRAARLNTEFVPIVLLSRIPIFLNHDDCLPGFLFSYEVETNLLIC